MPSKHATGSRGANPFFFFFLKIALLWPTRNSTKTSGHSWQNTFVVMGRGEARRGRAGRCRAAGAFFPKVEKTYRLRNINLQPVNFSKFSGGPRRGGVGCGGVPSCEAWTARSDVLASGAPQQPKECHTKQPPHHYPRRHQQPAMQVQQLVQERHVYLCTSATTVGQPYIDRQRKKTKVHPAQCRQAHCPKVLPGGRSQTQPISLELGHAVQWSRPRPNHGKPQQP